MSKIIWANKTADFRKSPLVMVCWLKPELMHEWFYLTRETDTNVLVHNNASYSATYVTFPMELFSLEMWYYYVYGKSIWRVCDMIDVSYA